MDIPVTVYIVLHFPDNYDGAINVAVFDDEQRALAYAYTRAVEASLGMRPVSDGRGYEEYWKGYRVLVPYDNDMKFQIEGAFLVEKHILNQPPELGGR